MKPSDRSWIAGHPVFESLPAADLDILLEAAAVHDLPADAVLFNQGDKPEFLHVLIDGRIGLTARGMDE